jgi:hypothetical protein
MFLNDLANNEAVKKYASSKELFEVAENYANGLMPSSGHQLMKEAQK